MAIPSGIGLRTSETATNERSERDSQRMNIKWSGGSVAGYWHVPLDEAIREKLVHRLERTSLVILSRFSY
jgi:hypothetical protein